MDDQREWYAVYTRPRWEKKIAEALGKKNVESFCPLNREIHQWADRKKVVYEPLFSCYVFVYASEPEYLSIRRTDGIINFVYWLGSPAKIRREEIEAIRLLAGRHEHIGLEKIDVNPADKVRVVRGPFMKLNGSVVEVKSRTVKVCLPSLGYALIAEISKDNIEIIAGMEDATVENALPHEIYG
jgi:transcription antitermination factor NusG